MDKIDDLNLLAGGAIPFGPLKVYQPTLKEINNIGFSEFCRITNLLTISEEELLLFYDKNKITDGETNPLQYLISQSLKSPVFFFEVQLSFFTYTKEEIYLDPKKKCFKFFLPMSKELPTKKIVEIKDWFYLNDENFPQFQSIIRAINFTKEEEDHEINSDDKKMVEKFKEARKKLKLAKAKERLKKTSSQENEISFSDMISSICCAGLGYTLFNIWDLTIYQLYNLFKRYQMRENFNIDLQMLLAGADSKKVKLQPWMKKITL